MNDGKKWIYSDHTIVDHNLIFYANKAWCQVDLDNFSTSYIYNVKNMEYLEKRGASRLITLNNAIYIISWDPLAIARYDSETKDIKQIYEVENGVANFICVEKWNNHLYLFRKNVDEMIVINESGEYKVYPFLVGVDKKNMYGCVVKDAILFFSQSSSVCYKYNLKNGAVSQNDLTFKLDNFQDVAYFQGQLFFLGEKYIKIWDANENVKHIDLYYESEEETIRGMLIPLKDKIYVLPRKDEDIFYIEYDGRVHKYDDYPEGYCYTRNEDWLKIGNKYISFVRENDFYYFPRRATNYMLMIDIKKQEIKWVEIMEPNVEEEVKFEIAKNGKIIEKRGYLSGYIGCIKNR